MSISIGSIYYHPKKPYDFVVVEALKDGVPIKQNLEISDFIMDLVSFPSRPIPDEKLFRRAEEVFLSRYK